MSSRRKFIADTTFAATSLILLPQWLQAGVGPKRPASPMATFPFRQVHLDFHNSGLIGDVAHDFDPEAFAATLKKAYVNSVTVFGRCHHGYIYHDSKKFADRKHPSLTRNLLKEQIEACHKANIRTPVYVTVQWDELTAKQHPEWLMRDDHGAPIANGNSDRFAPGFYNHLCVLSPYRQFLKEYIADLFEQVPVDGLFLDIHHVRPNANEYCVDAMVKKGLDPSKEEVRYQFYKEVVREYKAELTSFIQKLDKSCSIFYNGGHVGPQIRNTISYNTHLELESLPSGGWGYLHFPLSVRYARNFGLEVMGMTGKFHTSWGDFHSLKNRAALEFETSMMLAMNAKCSIGDQLHPRGKLDEATYDLIGAAYKKVAEKEPWCEGAKAVTEVGVVSAEEFMAGEVRQPKSMLGAIQMFHEGGIQFDVLDSNSDLAPYKVLVLPDDIPVNDVMTQKLRAFLQKGGSLIASFRSGLTPKGDEFAMDEWGVSYVGPAPFSPDYIRTGGAIAEGLPETELVMYDKGLQVKEKSGSVVLAQVDVPYFNREWDHFSSHKHTPSTGKPGYPGVVQKGRLIYFMHPIFSQYARNAPYWCKKLVLNAFNRLVPSPLIRHNGPTSLLAALNSQRHKNRYVLHLLHYIPERKGAEFDIVENIIPLVDLQVSLLLPTPVTKARLVPQNINLPLQKKDNRISLQLARLEGHQMIELA